MSFFDELVTGAGGVFVIAEACDNHMGSMEMARSLARAAKVAGADAVKFQHHLPDEEMLRSARMSDNFEEHLYDFLIENALSLAQHQDLKSYCDDIGITYLCTPFSYKAAVEVRDLVPFFKVGSGEFKDHWMIDQLVDLRLPVLFSTGMCSLDEVKSNVTYLKKLGVDFGLMNCLSEYPPRLSDMNLKVINDFIALFPGITIGHSDHTDDIFTSVSAVTLGAKIVEKHLTLSSLIHGPDRDVSLNPIEFARLVKSVKHVPETLGSEKTVHSKEKPVREWAYRSVVAATRIDKGAVITEEMLCTKRPGTGIPSENYKDLIGQVAKDVIEKNTMVSWEQIDAQRSNDTLR